jgi:tripartite-type tricarboxylate transporter receptor subunit TctC
MIGAHRFALVIACLLVFTAPASAQNYPSKPIRIVVPFAVGGPADIYARFVGQKLLEDLKQPVVVDNRPGAGSLVGTAEAARAAPDGHTLLMMSNTHTTNESLVPNKTYKLMNDFVPVAPVNSSDLVMVVHPSVPATSLQEFIALAKAKPGTLNYASSGTGTPYHMAGELFKSMSGTDILHVPYKGSSGARNDVLSGQVMMMFDAITTMAGNVEANQVRALGTTGPSRSSVLPNVPTIAEAGVPGYAATIWVGLMAPVGTPQAIVDQLNRAISRIVSSADVRDAWQKQGAQPMVMTPADFRSFLEGDVEKWAKIVAISGAKPE